MRSIKSDVKAKFPNWEGGFNSCFMEGVKFDIGKRYQGLLSLMRNENLKRIKEIGIAFKLMLIVR